MSTVRRQAWIHVGVPGPGDIVEAALAHHHHALAELGVCAPTSTAESFRAALEITRTHRDWDLRRADVEGQWLRLVRRAEHAHADLVLSQSLLAAATPHQVALVDGALARFRLQVVVSTGSGDPAAALAAWRTVVRRPDRVHLLETDGLAPEQVWRTFGRLVGFGTASLRLDVVPRPASAVDTLAEARQEMERLARRNASLELRLAGRDGRRRLFRRRLTAA